MAMLREQFVGVFARSCKASIAFIMSVCLPVDVFLWNLVWGTSFKFYWEISYVVKNRKNIGKLTWRPKLVSLLPVTLKNTMKALPWTGKVSGC